MTKHYSKKEEENNYIPDMSEESRGSSDRVKSPEFDVIGTALNEI